MDETERQADSMSTGTLVIRAAIGLVVSLGVWGGLLFGTAGTAGWWQAWTHLGLCVVMLVVNVAALRRWNPAVLAARMKRQRIDRTFDKVIMICALPAMLAIPILAGLDAVRYRWAPLPLWLAVVGIVLHLAGDALMLWSMVVNPYLEKFVRIQGERGHQVISTGPYAVVRHPMYAGFIVAMVGMPILLGSSWALVPVGAAVLLMAIRVVFEERVLREELPGYEAYTRQTRYRLVPGAW